MKIDAGNTAWVGDYKGVPVRYVSVGPSREATFTVE